MTSKFEQNFYYWMLPSAFALILALLYYTGIPVLQAVVAPKFSRELGLLESTQHLLILAVIWMAVRGWRGAQSSLERFGYTLAIALASFQFLEEINFGQHYVRAFLHATGRQENDLLQMPWNVHNRGISSALKTAGDIVIMLYFFVFPLITTQRWPAWLQYLAPPRMVVTTVLGSVIISKFIHFVSDNTTIVDDAFKVGVSEFRETFIYYFVLLYVRELATKRRWPGFVGGNSSGILK